MKETVYDYHSRSLNDIDRSHYKYNYRTIFNDLDKSHYKYYKPRINHTQEFNRHIDFLIDQINRFLKD